MSKKYAVYVEGDNIRAFPIGDLTVKEVKRDVVGNYFVAEGTSPGRAVQEALAKGFKTPVGAIFTEGPEEVINLGQGLVSYFIEPERGGRPEAKGNFPAPIR